MYSHLQEDSPTLSFSFNYAVPFALAQPIVAMQRRVYAPESHGLGWGPCDYPAEALFQGHVTTHQELKLYFVSKF